ncbi:MAG: hypothetical protein AB3N34_01245 [Lettuce witches'-broom phytoplasma]
MSKKRLSFIIMFSILGVLLLFIIAIILVIILNPKKTPVGPIPAPTVEIKREWFKTKDRTNVGEGTPMIEAVYTFYGLEGLGYYEKQIALNEKKISALKEKFHQTPLIDIVALKKEIETLGVETYGEAFYDQIDPQYLNSHPNIKTMYYLQQAQGIKSLKHRLNTQKEPTDLAYFVKYPFNQWIDEGVDYFRIFSRNSQNNNTESFFSSTANLFQEPDLHKFEFHFKGPKYLLELDQDCFIYPVNAPIKVRNSGLADTYLNQTYYLHLNPVRQTLSLYTEKFNTGGEYKPPSD